MTPPVKCMHSFRQEARNDTVALTQITSENEVQHKYFPLYYNPCEDELYFIPSFIPLGTNHPGLTSFSHICDLKT